MTMAPNHVSVTDYGAIAGSRVGCTEAVQKAIHALGSAGGTVEFPKGTYHFYRSEGIERQLFLSNSDVVNPRKIAILVENRKNIKIQGNGSTLIFHDRIISFAVLGSQKVDVQDLVVDWERPLMSQGVVVASGVDGFTLKIDPIAYPYVVNSGHLYFKDATWEKRVWSFMEFDPATRGVAPETGDQGFTDGDWNGAAVTELANGTVRFEYKCSRYPKVGDILVARHGTRDHAGSFIEGSSDVRLSHVSYRHTSGLGVLCQYSSNLTFDHVEVAPDPTSNRMFAGHDDGLHISNCKGHIEVNSCRFEGLMDDPINIHGTSVRIIKKVDSTTLRCRFMHPQSVGLRFGDAGDEIALLNHETMETVGVASLVSMKSLSPEEFEVKFARHIGDKINEGDALENLTWTPSATIKKSVFGCVRARGLLMSTPRPVLIEQNVFRSSGAAILIPGDANYWFESGAVHDVTIRNNDFENCNSSPYQFGDAVISIHPEIPKTGRKAFHTSIHIEGNRFKVFDAPVLWAKSVDGLTFHHNTVLQTSKFRPSNSKGAGITLIDCQNTVVTANQLDPKFIGKRYRIVGDSDSIRVDGWGSAIR